MLLPPMLNGVVLHQKMLGVETVKESEKYIWLRVAGGENWHALVELCVNNQWHGLENLALIPGTVGAAPIQNIGAYGSEVKDHIESVEWFDMAKQKAFCFSAAQCEFDYRDSIFKNRLAGAGIVTHVKFRLAKSFDARVEYPSLKAYLDENNPNTPVTSKMVFDAVCAIRTQRLPDPKVLPNCGSFFKNPIISKQLFNELVKQFSGVPSFDTSAPEMKKIPAAWLIDQAGWKGRELFDVCIHAQHALVLINPKLKSLDNVLQLAEAITESVKQKFGIQLEMEPQKLSPR